MSQNAIAFILISSFVSLITGIIVLAVFFDKKRTAGMQAIAERFNFDFLLKSPGPPSGYSFGLFGKGHARRRKNIMSGEAQGVSLMICDYRYTTGHGKNSSTHNQTVCLLEDTDLSLPQTFVRHQHGVFDWLGAKLGGQDIDFEEDTAFSKAFVLQGEGETETRELYTPELRNYLLEHKKGVRSMDTVSNTLLINCGRAIRPDQMDSLLELVFGIRDRMLTG